MVQPASHWVELVERLEEGETLTTDELLELGEQPDAVDTLIGFSDESEARRLALLPTIIELGRVVIAENEETDEPERPGPIVTDPEVIAYLVQRLDDDASEVRDTASEALAEMVPSELLVEYTEVLLRQIEEFPENDSALLLLGKLDDPTRALELLDDTPALGAADSDNVIMVRARLGDPDAERALYAAYFDTDEPEEKGALAPRLGYAATDLTLEVLADEIRSPDTYFWVRTARRTLRIHIIEGLHLAFPMEPLFWTPFYRPEDDGYYEAIEQWLTDRLGTTWNRPRPEFLYQEDSPAPPRGGR